MLALVTIVATCGWFLPRAHAPPRSPAASATSAQDNAADTGASNTARDPRGAKPAARSKRDIASTPLPSRGAPLAQIYDELKARADAGDAAAASRLFHDIGRCKAVLDSIPLIRKFIADPPGGGDSALSADALAQREKVIASFQRQLPKYEQLAAGECANLGPTQTQIMPAALRAAQLGDNNAADCYVGMPVPLAHGLIDHPEWLLQYKENALALADAAIRRGDWTMVQQLQMSYAEKSITGIDLLHQLTGSDPAMAYRYSRLLLLGMTEHPDVSKVYLDQQRARAMESLSPALVDTGDKWADDVHRRYFGPDQSARTSEMGICDVGDNEVPAR